MKIRSAAMHPMLWPGHLLAVLVLLFVALAPARAHQASDAYLNWRIDGERIEQRIDLSLRDLDRELVLDADDDGVLRWGEIRSREADIIRLVDAALQPRADGSFTLPDGRVLTRADEVVTFVARNLEPYRGFHIFMRALPELLRRRPRARVLLVGGNV